jgi:3-deoxy-manno-octulosonate cytidylyltransferase (CMP-KDO synthetase)
MLLKETGRSLIEHTHAAACGARRAKRVIVATDDERIAEEVLSFGGEAVLTSPDCASGTDRVAEVARKLPQYELFVNVQGDEPELDPAAIDRAIELLEQNPTAAMSTLAAPIRDAERLRDPANVKVVFGACGRALYFSRSPIPFVRDEPEAALEAEPPLYHHHVGLYAYRREFLLRLASLPPSRLELAERLEQLRVLEAGETILVGVIPHAAAGIDTPADYARFVQRYSRRMAA